MGLLRNIRELVVGATLQGVQDPGSVDVITPVQAVQLWGDLTHLTQEPVQTPYFFARINTNNASVAGRSFIQITPRRQPVELLGYNIAGIPAFTNEVELFLEATDQEAVPGTNVTHADYPTQGMGLGAIGGEANQAMLRALIESGLSANTASGFRIEPFTQLNSLDAKVISEWQPTQWLPIPIYCAPPNRIIFMGGNTNDDIVVSFWCRERPQLARSG